MTTDINEIYKKYPCAKKQAEENIEFWDSEESLNKLNMPDILESGMKIHTSDEELYKFFETIIHYDAFLLKQNEITLEEEKKRNDKIEKLTTKHLGHWHSALYSSPLVEEPFLDDIAYYKIFCEDNM
jgi:hypothetical protein